MKKSRYRALIIQQSNQINKLERENRFLRDKISGAKDSVIRFLSDMVTGIRND